MIQTGFFEPPHGDQPIGAVDEWARDCGFTRVVGVDEAGRGPLAGPVVAAAVSLPTSPLPAELAELDDSKQLTERQRKHLFEAIQETAHAVGVAVIDSVEIDRINILQSTLKAMHQAVDQVQERLSRSIDVVFVDGNRIIPDRRESQWALVKGDSRAWCIAAASVVAKVTRDRMMEHYHKQYPWYGFDRHKGYGTVAHRRALMAHGPSPIHRRSFRWRQPD
ncbi:MAG: ribonuclease HII [Myxococcota bacterium]|nr:ribonuclease HII [Myxococcota bacterium]